MHRLQAELPGGLSPFDPDHLAQAFQQPSDSGVRFHRLNVAIRYYLDKAGIDCCTPISSESLLIEEVIVQPSGIAGYRYGEASLASSPVSIEELRLLEATVMFTEEDTSLLATAAEILEPQIEDILDVWYGFVGANPHLLASFSDAAGEPNSDYLAAVRARFGEWIRDLCRRPHDQAWLDYQHEIAVRHHHTKKNETDAVEASRQVQFRYLVALLVPITATIRPFLAQSDRPAEEVDQIHAAWFKAVTLSVTLWCYPYIRDGDF